MFRRLSFLSLIVFLILSACSAPTAAPTATASAANRYGCSNQHAAAAYANPIPPSPTPETPVLEIVGPDGTTLKNLTMSELLAMPVTEGQGGIKSSTGKITVPAPFKGVALKDLAALVPEFDETMGINVVANDGYAITFSYNQVMNGTFIQYDPGTGDELKNPVPLTAILAYEMNGQPLDPTQDGNCAWRWSATSRNRWWMGIGRSSGSVRLEIRDLGQDWSLHLEGTISEDMDRATFESGAAPNCHGVTWKDDKAQDWLGIPLWLLVGRVDDDIKHEGPAFNDALSAAGYTIEVVASDGYTVTFDSARVQRNNNIIVAFQVNGNPLPDKYFPLRLVGNDLAKNEMVGMISQHCAAYRSLEAAGGNRDAGPDCHARTGCQRGRSGDHRAGGERAGLDGSRPARHGSGADHRRASQERPDAVRRRASERAARPGGDQAGGEEAGADFFGRIQVRGLPG